MPAKLTQEQFLDRAKAIHGDSYGYSLAEYKGTKISLKILCHKHGLFEQAPDGHIGQKQGCPKCKNLLRMQVRAIGPPAFISRAREIHGQLYDYSQATYSNNSSKVKIICLKHGVFKQTSKNHLLGQGCPECGKIKQGVSQRSENAALFTSRARAVHGEKYDYSETTYTKFHSKAKIICLKHGVFQQAPAQHLSGHSCPTCSKIRVADAQRQTQEDFYSKSSPDSWP